MRELTVELNEKSYPITIQHGLLSDIEKYLDGGRRYFVITNKSIQSIYKDFLNRFENLVVIEDGEEFKNFSTFEYIIDKLLEAKIERSDCVIAFGGGVVGDLAGFAAASVLRGVDYIQIPTTLLSQVDSSVGGKTGFNHKMGKNLIGAFKQPKKVLIDPNTLATLDLRQLKTGMGEVLKYAFIEKTTGCREFFDFFNFLKNLFVQSQLQNDSLEKANINRLYEDIIKHAEQIIYASVSMKASVVSKDECEKGLRAILNFGHTFGHSVEKITDYKKYTHGEAVAAGMIMAFNTALSRNLIDKNYYTDAIKLIKDYGLISADMKNFDKDKIYDGMKSDKKVSHSKIKLVLPTSPLEVRIFDDTEEPLIKASLL